MFALSIRLRMYAARVAANKTGHVTHVRLHNMVCTPPSANLVAWG